MKNGSLELRSVLDELALDGLLNKAAVNAIGAKDRSGDQVQLHPLVYLAGLHLNIVGEKNRQLDMLHLLSWLGDKTDLPVAQIDPLSIQVAKVTDVMSFQFAKRHNILCIDVGLETITIATTEPYVTSWLADLEKVTGKAVRQVLADPAEVNKYRIEFYTLKKSVFGAKAQNGKLGTSTTNFEELLDIGKLKDPDAQDQHIVSIVDWLLQYAFEQRASDIHVEPRREMGKVRFRIDGVLHQVYELPADVLTAVTSRIKILGRMNVAEKRRPQDGRIKTRNPAGNEVELRLSTLPTAFGEKLVMRIFDPEVLLKSFDQLGLNGRNLELWNTMTEQAHGIVLVTGPTGSGKTTTLYSTLKRLAKETVNVSTIEDPIEMIEESFNQTQVQHNIELDFAMGIRTLMRQDPDIIMVGEIRDAETANMAVQAAMTGHLVLSTLHTNDAPSAITRLIDLGVPAHLLRVTVNGIVAQRLVRTLCPHCKEPQMLGEVSWKELTAPLDLPIPKHLYAPVGCLECRNTGYLGRQGLFEILPLSSSIKKLIKDDADIASIRAQGIKEGMRTLRMSGARKVAEGQTSIAEVLRVVPDTEF